MRATRFIAPALVGAALMGCVDSPTSSLAPGEARLVLAPQFIQNGQAAGLPIEVIRVTPRFFPSDSAAGNPTRIEVPNPNAPEFRINVPIDLGGRDSATVRILVELISESSGADVVEWSALVGPVSVTAGRTSVEQSPTTLYRGPIANMNVDSVIAFGPEFMLAGTSHPAHATVLGEGTGFTVVWASTNPAVATVDPVGTDVQVHAHGHGLTWIVAGAGTKADSFQVVVDTATPGQPAFLFMHPSDSVVMVPGSTRQFSAVVTDSSFIPLTVTIDWQSLDPGIATVNAAGVVSAAALGRARIVASSGALADTAIVNVEALPVGVDRMWIGGTLLAENDWFTADNWSPSGVPSATDVVYIPAGSEWLSLTANASVGSLLADSTGAYSFDIFNNTLTINGDLIAPYVLADSLGRVVMAGTGDLWAFSLPGLTISGNVTAMEDVYAGGDVIITGPGARLDLQRMWSLYADGDLSVIGGSLVMGRNDTTFEESLVYVAGDVLYDGGDSSGDLTGGWLHTAGDFTVTAASCTAFQPTGTGVQLFVDTSTISLGCAGPSGNRFYDLGVYQAAAEPVLELNSDVYVMNELYLDGGDGMLVDGNLHTFQARMGSAYWATFDRTFIEVVGLLPSDGFYTDSIILTGMSGQTRPQVVFEHPGFCNGCYGNVDVIFDPGSEGAFIEVTDTDPPGDTLIVYMERNPGNGPSRTVTSGGAVVHWADVPFYLFTYSGSFQSGQQHQPLPDSLVVQVVDYAYYGASGTTVNFAVTAGDGSVSPASDVTDEDGFARTQYTVGDTAFATHEVVGTSSALPADTAFFYGFPTPVSGGVTPQPTRVRAAPPQAQPAPARRQPGAWPLPPAPRRGTNQTGEGR